MVNEDQFSSGWDSPHRSAAADLLIEDAFKAKVPAILKSSLESTVESLVERVEYEWNVFYAEPIHKWQAQRTELSKQIERQDEEAANLEKRLNEQSIPVNRPGDTSFTPPPGFWAKLAFYGLLAFSLLASLFEWINFGWFLRFAADSFAVGLTYSFAVFAIPVGEAAYLLILKPSERVRKVIATIQACCAIAAAMGYIYLSLVRGETTLDSLFSATKPGFPYESWRMAFQLLTSLTISALCLHGSFCMGKLQQTPNPEYKNALQRVAQIHCDNSDVVDRIAKLDGFLTRAQAVKTCAVLFCRQKHAQVQESHRYHHQLVNQITKERI